MPVEAAANGTNENDHAAAHSRDLYRSRESGEKFGYECARFTKFLASNRKIWRSFFREYEDPFKNVADFDDDDSPEVPTDSMRKQERRQYAVDVAHCAPLGAAGIVAPMGPFCIPRVSTRGYDCSTPLRKRKLLRMCRFRQSARKNKENFGKKREPGGLVLLICFLPAAPDTVPAPHPPARRKCLPGCDTRHPEHPDLPLPDTR